ncbi:MAG: universal stress protein [Thaumarchaeota archaeon]|nr:universal stress protein [Nitrososphaerota archaeon]
MTQRELHNQREVLAEIELGSSNDFGSGFRTDENSSRELHNSGKLEGKVQEIIVPINNATTDGKVLRYASELARSFSARIALVYSVPPLIMTEGIN